MYETACQCEKMVKYESRNWRGFEGVDEDNWKEERNWGGGKRQGDGSWEIPEGGSGLACARQAGWSGAEIWVRIDWPNTDHRTLPLCFGHREKLFRDKCPGMSSGVTIAQEPCGKELEPRLYLGVRHTQTRRCGAMES